MSSSESPDYFEGAGYDPETTRFFDVAHEGAQIRSVAGAVTDMDGLRGNTVRSVVVIGTDHLPRAAARLAAAARSPLRVPLVVTDALPTYVGALDVVVAVTDRGDDPEVARALITASARGADTVLAGPARGPLLDDVPSGTVVVPALPTVAGFSPARVIATVDAVLDLIEGGDVPAVDRLEHLADGVDAEVELLSPERDESVNPGRAIRAFVDGARVLHTGPVGDDHTGVQVALLAADLWSAKGLASGFADPAEFPAALGETPGEVTGSSHDIFHDPFLDGPVDLLPLKVIVWAAEDSGLPGSLPVSADHATPAAGTMDTVLRLLTRALAVPTYSV